MSRARAKGAAPGAAPTLDALLGSARWFHAIDFGGGRVSPGRFAPDVPPNHTLYGVLEILADLADGGGLAGARVVDVGTMDGLVAFACARLGAGEVIATDLARRTTFEAGRAALGVAVDYRVPLAVTDLPEALGGELGDRPDLVVMAGVLYHVLDPVAVLEACRRALRLGGYLLMETSYLFDEGGSRMSFNPHDDSARGVERANVFWRPSQRALEGMLQLVGFEVVRTIAVDGRLTALARARRPSEIPGRSARMASIHATYMRYRNYREKIDFGALEHDPGEPSRLDYRGPRGHGRIYPARWRPRVPLQPAWTAPPRAIGRLLARSAWFDARARLAEARAAVRRRRRRRPGRSTRHLEID